MDDDDTAVLEQLTLSPRVRFAERSVDCVIYGHAIMLTLFGNMHRTSMWRRAMIVTPAEWTAHVHQTLLGMKAASDAAATTGMFQTTGSLTVIAVSSDATI